MKRILLAGLVGAVLLAGGLVGTASADGPHGHGHGNHHHGHRHHGHHHHGHHHHHHHGHYHGYYGPNNVYRPLVVPYGAGYSGGYQPYGGVYVQKPRFGLYLGF